MQNSVARFYTVLRKNKPGPMKIGTSVAHGNNGGWIIQLRALQWTVIIHWRG